MLDLNIPTFTEEALCAQSDPDAWFPDQGANISPLTKAICGRCPAQEPCLKYAVDNKIKDGVWGGLTPRERRPLHTGSSGRGRCKRGHDVTPGIRCGPCRKLAQDRLDRIKAAA